MTERVTIGSFYSENFNPEDMNLNTVIDLIDVHKAFKDHKAINGISLQIREGEFIALLGPNGAGKSTVLKALFGLIASP